MANVGAVDQVRADLEAARNEKQAQIAALQGEVAQIDGALTALAGLPSGNSTPAPAAAAAAPPPAASAPAKPKPANGRRRRAKAATDAAAPAAKAKPKAGNGRRRRATKSRPGTISAAVEDFLDTKHPNAVHAAEVLDHLASSGSTPGGNARNVLQSTLNRLQERGTVRNVGKNRWRRIRPRGRQAAS